MSTSSSPNVVIIDDDPMIGQVMASYLRKLSFTPAQTAQPRRGLEMIRGSKHLLFVVCDVQMPGLDGPELIRVAAESKPNLRVLFVSGYDMAELQEEGVPGAIVQCLGKPFSMDGFSDAVAELLSRAVPPAPDGEEPAD